MCSVIDNGILYQDVTFVDSAEKADLEVLYDRMKYDKESDCFLYFRHRYLVATKKRK